MRRGEVGEYWDTNRLLSDGRNGRHSINFSGANRHLGVRHLEQPQSGGPG